MPSLADLAGLAATLGAGLTAGLCFTFAAFALRAFDRLTPSEAIRAMQSINAAILRSSAMFVWFAPLPLGLAAAGLSDDPVLSLAAAGLHALGAVAITGLANVPLNEALDRVDPEAPDAEGHWRRFRDPWSRWNALRTVLISLATLGFALAV